MREGLVPGVNVDLVDVAAGMKMASDIGYADPSAQMVVEFALMRHRRGEEEGAQRTWLSEYPRDLTSWAMILAHALASAEHGRTRDLIAAAGSYLDVAQLGPDAWHDQDGANLPPGGWPWGPESWDPTDDQLGNLLKARGLVEEAIRSVGPDADSGIAQTSAEERLVAVIRAASPEPLGEAVLRLIARAVLLDHERSDG